MRAVNTKSIIKSKTAWVNAIMFLASFLPAVQEWLAANPVPLLAAFAAVNVLVRFATSGKVTLFSDDGTAKNGGGSGGISPLLVIGAAAALSLAGFGLSSCSPVYAIATGQVPPATAVQRAGDGKAPVVMVASGDLAQAEEEAVRAEVLNESAPVNGLYDIGKVVDVSREVFTGSSK